MTKRPSKYSAPLRRAPAKLAGEEAREVETTAVKSKSGGTLEFRQYQGADHCTASNKRLNARDGYLRPACLSQEMQQLKTTRMRTMKEAVALRKRAPMPP